MTEKIRKCSKCGEVLTLENSSTTIFHVGGYCRKCQRDYKYKDVPLKPRSVKPPNATLSFNNEQQYQNAYCTAHDLPIRGQTGSIDYYDESIGYVEFTRHGVFDTKDITRYPQIAVSEGKPYKIVFVDGDPDLETQNILNKLNIKFEIFDHVKLITVVDGEIVFSKPKEDRRESAALEKSKATKQHWKELENRLVHIRGIYVPIGELRDVIHKFDDESLPQEYTKNSMAAMLGKGLADLIAEFGIFAVQRRWIKDRPNGICAIPAQQMPAHKDHDKYI